jgi:hypothetical protein
MMPNTGPDDRAREGVGPPAQSNPPRNDVPGWARLSSAETGTRRTHLGPGVRSAGRPGA